MRVLGSVLVLAAALAYGCGGDSEGGGSGGTSTGGSSTGGSSTGGSSTGGSSTGGAAGSGGGASTTPCGTSLECNATSVCIVDEIAPACTAKQGDGGDACPPGQTESQCGGIGYPCCCEPPPAPTYHCEDAGGCSSKPECGCLGSVCVNGQMCIGIGGKEREFHCIDPPAA
ncbi:MAG: hypothetical protein IPI67_06975 [Myxococcales bacterium]|nr:hypothetical protein [Myxococcales bacterium]